MLLESNLLQLEDLKKLSWSGVPVEVRPMTWRLLAVSQLKMSHIKILYNISLNIV